MEGITIAHKDHRVVITVDTDVVDRHRIEQALSLVESDDLLDTALGRAMQETANDDEIDLEEAKRIVGRSLRLHSRRPSSRIENICRKTTETTLML